MCILALKALPELSLLTGLACLSTSHRSAFCLATLSLSAAAIFCISYVHTKMHPEAASQKQDCQCNRDQPALAGTCIHLHEQNGLPLHSGLLMWLTYQSLTANLFCKAEMATD